MSMQSVSPRDLRTRGKEIFDAVERGQTFRVTRDGHEIAALVPIHRPRTFVSRDEFAAMSTNAPSIDLARFRADQDATVDGYLDSPYDR